MNIRSIALYLPQYHPIPENDKWWGKGFTEWTNVTKAKPLYKGHRQPKLPGELGFYDLRIPEVREAQANMAKAHGIYAFCYWHYWFGNGKRIIERPFMEVLSSGKPDFPFCLAWANQTWSGHWHGKDEKVLIQQEYHGEKDYKSHFETVLPAFKDKRYVLVDEKPVVLVYNPRDIPDPKQFVEIWNKLAQDSGLEGIFFIAMSAYERLQEFGMNGTTKHEPTSQNMIVKPAFKKILRRNGFNNCPKIIQYSDFVDITLNDPLGGFEYPVVVPNWDNTPRCQHKGLVFKDSTPDLFGKHFQKAIDLVKNRDKDHQLIFIKSWNEWAEGNMIEPDREFERGYLEAIKERLFNTELKTGPKGSR